MEEEEQVGPFTVIASVIPEVLFRPENPAKFREPTAAHEGDALDLFSHGGTFDFGARHDLNLVPVNEIRGLGHHLPPRSVVLISAGFSMEMPPEYRSWITPRSGLAKKFKVTVANSPGLIDNAYRGNVGVLLRNDSEDDIFIPNGFAIAQMTFTKILPLKFRVVTEELSTTDRGENGFGSTSGFGV